MNAPALEVLRDLSGVARSLGFRWYLFGAQAVVAHGFIRHTADVDVTVEFPAERITELVAALS